MSARHARHLVTLLTDFGTRDAYVAAMKGVILRRDPDARLVDISHEVPPQEILSGALLLAAVRPYFPAGTVHLAVIDPGVGSGRRILVASAQGHLFVGPDNGLLDLALGPTPHVYAARIGSAWRRRAAPTFHGRDIMAPLAARLARGTPPARLGRRVASWVRLDLPKIRRSPQQIASTVVQVDAFGNLVTNIQAADIPRGAAPDEVTVTVAGRRIIGLVPTYAAAPRGALLAVWGSTGFLEVSVREGSAARRLGARRGTPVIVRFARR